MQNGLFCQIVAGVAPCHMIWEDARHLAFLSILPHFCVSFFVSFLVFFLSLCFFLFFRHVG